MTIRKKKRVSKKNKSAWRKHTDIKDVEAFLADQSQAERIGSICDKKDEDIFAVDTKANKKALTEKQKRKANALKQPKTYEALKNTSRVPDPIVKRNTVKQKKSGRIIEEEVRNPTKPKHFQANKDRQSYYEKLDKKLAKSKLDKNFEKDIWLEEDFRDKTPGLKDERGWISKDLSLYIVKNIGKPVIKVHDSIRHKTTKAKKFEPPHPGISYNPSLSAHLDLIANVVNKEETIIKEKAHLKRVTTEKFSKVTAEQRDSERIREMKSGLPQYEDVDENNVENEQNSLTKSNPPVENKKKTKQARNKELKQKELTKQTKLKKELKKQIADLNRIKSIKSEVLAEEEKLNLLKKHRKKVQFKKKFEPKRLGRLKFVEPEIDINMPEDLAGNLRNVKTESSLLIDRFKNFQKRNILPTSVHTGKQKGKKIKRFVRSSHKEPEVSMFKKK